MSALDMAIAEIEKDNPRYGWRVEKVFFMGSDLISKTFYIGTIALVDEEETEVQRSGETAAQALNAVLAAVKAANNA